MILDFSEWETHFDFTPEESLEWKRWFEIMQNYILETSLPIVLRHLPKHDDNPYLTNLNLFLNFIEKSDNQTLNRNILILKDDNNCTVLAIRTRMQNQYPPLDLKVLFPNAAGHRKKHRNWFLHTNNDKEYSKKVNESTFAGSTKIKFSQLDLEIKLGILSRYGQLDTTKTCTEDNVCGFMKEFYQESDSQNIEENPEELINNGL